MGIFGWDYPPGCHFVPGDEDVPEVCPVCGAENYDPETNKWAFGDGPYCSATCRDRDYENMRAEAEAEAARLNHNDDQE